jgi:hypothetical protein
LRSFAIAVYALMFLWLAFATPHKALGADEASSKLAARCQRLLALGSPFDLAAPGFSRFLLPLLYGGRATGQVVDSLGEPIVASFSLRSSTGMILAFGAPDAKGELNAHGFPIYLPCEIEVGAEGYRTLQQPSATAGRVAFGELLLLRHRIVAGTLVDVAGTPIAGGRVYRLRTAQEKGEVDTVAFSDAAGHFELDANRMGDAEILLADAPGFAQGSWKVVSGPPETEIGRWTLEPEVRRRGIVVDLDGAPIAGTQIFLQNFETRLEQGLQQAPIGRPWAVTGHDGTFVVTGLPEGNEAALEFRATGFLPALVLIRELDDAGNEITLGRGVWIRGMVHDTQGRPVPAALIELKDAHNASHHGWSDLGGAFEVGPIAPGRWQVSASYGTSGVGQQVEIPEEGLQDLEIIFDDPHLEGIVVDSRGFPVEGAQIMLSDGNGRSFSQSNPDGRFRSSGSAYGEIRLTATHAEFGSVERVLQLSRSTEFVELRLPDQEKLSALTVRVESARSGDPIALAAVALQDSMNALYRAETDRQGEAAFHDLVVPRRYRETIAARGFVSMSVEVALTSTSATDLRYRLEPGIRVRGRVVRMPPFKLATADLSVHVANQPAPTAIHLDRASGEFAIEGLAAGRWTLVLRAGRYESLNQEIEVRGDATGLILDWSKTRE